MPKSVLSNENNDKNLHQIVYSTELRKPFCKIRHLQCTRHEGKAALDVSYERKAEICYKVRLSFPCHKDEWES